DDINSLMLASEHLHDAHDRARGPDRIAFPKGVDFSNPVRGLGADFQAGIRERRDQVRHERALAPSIGPIDHDFTRYHDAPPGLPGILASEPTALEERPLCAKYLCHSPTPKPAP